MTSTEIIIECAKLDGEDKHVPVWVGCGSGIFFHAECRICNFSTEFKKKSEHPTPKPYTTSRDAIVPVIEKQLNYELFTSALCKIVLGYTGDEQSICLNYLALSRVLRATPLQLCEALLRATGKWKEVICF